MTLGEKIYNLRKTVNLSQEEFGNIFNVSRQSVSKWETNQVQPELKTIIEMAKYFHVSLDELLLEQTNEKENVMSFEEIYNRKMKFYFGCIILFIGILLFIVSVIISWSYIAYCGSIFNYFYAEFRNGDFMTLLYYLFSFVIMGLGLYMMIKTINKR